MKDPPPIGQAGARVLGGSPAACSASCRVSPIWAAKSSGLSGDPWRAPLVCLAKGGLPMGAPPGVRLCVLPLPRGWVGERSRRPFECLV